MTNFLKKSCENNSTILLHINKYKKNNQAHLIRIMIY